MMSPIGCTLLLTIDPGAILGNKRSIETRPLLESVDRVTCWSLLGAASAQVSVPALWGSVSSANTLDECRTSDLHLMRFFLSACWMVVAASCALERANIFFFFLLPLDFGTVATSSEGVGSMLDALPVIAVIVDIVDTDS